ncbi:MAG: EamA family transporter [Patescibacteria group bacterium]|nr:EamA family transporter [Patescibacteria group bacterium]
MNGNYIGIGFALGAFLTWGIGDYLIQKTTRKTDVWRALGYLGAIGGIVLLPWAIPQLSAAAAQPPVLLLLGLSALLACVTAPITFSAYRKGKLAVVSPILALELPLTVILALLIGRERLSGTEALIILAIVIGTLLVARRRPLAGTTEKILEQGALLALFAAVGQAAGNFIIGKISQASFPILAVWVGHTAVAVECLVVIAARRQWQQVRDDWHHFPKLIFAQGASDVSAWVCYALATVFIPISIAVAVSESYVALAVLLGVVVNRERLNRWQGLGIVLAVLGVIILSALSG